MRGNEIRRTFLDFFRERGHAVLPSASLVPEDPTLLLTVAGMVPFKPYFLGQKPVEHPRIATVQKVARTNDIENVGLTARHLTMFEMLGNFSFGDYYKEDAIRWGWELSTGDFGLDPERIWVTVYQDDDESVAIWNEHVGLPMNRIIRRGAADNFWWMGVAGPGGPSSEMFYDRGPAYGDVDGFEDGDRIMEYYNLVFTEKEVDDTGQPVGDLPRKNVDTGMGFERIALILQRVPNAYETDLLRPIVARAEAVSGRPYGEDERSDVSLRIIAEHVRASSFLIGDGVMPGNEGRGYILRRLIRRAVRHAKLLGVEDVMMPQMVDAVIAVMGEAYPELVSGRAYIEQVATSEEEGFRGTLRTGLAMLDGEIAAAKNGSRTSLAGDTAFRLHDTYGFPFELTLEIATEAGLEIERSEFDRLMGEQRERARAARKVEMVDDEALRVILAAKGPSTFNGYDRSIDEAPIVGLVRSGISVEEAGEGQQIEIIARSTPFYPEGGGQIGDAGIIEVDGGTVQITDTQRRLGDLIVHLGTVVEGSVSVGADAQLRVDNERREATMRSHTATHIMHATLRAALGEHARQAGSLVEPGRLRFDFPHFDRVPREVLDEVEATVNARLLADETVRPYETTMEEARNRGAMMLFEEKYGDVVRVVEIGDYSVELCGGIHVAHTSQVGLVSILGEGSIGSNLRRVEALTGAEAIMDFRRSRAVLEHIASLLRASPDDAPAKVERLLADLKAREAELKKSQTVGERARATELARAAERVGDTALVVSEVPGLDVDGLRRLAVEVREALGGSAAVILASGSNGKAGIAAALDKDSASKVKARTLIADAAKAIGGGAGGKDDLAAGGGNQPDGVTEALRLARAAAEEVLR